MNLPIDINARIEKDFQNKEDGELVKELLASITLPERERVIRCILFAANGDLNKIGQLESLARIDYRDVIMIGEYQYPSKKLRNLNVPFKI